MPQGRYNNHGTLVSRDSGRYASADHDPVVSGWSAVPAAGPAGFTLLNIDDSHRSTDVNMVTSAGTIESERPAAQSAGGPVAAGGGNNYGGNNYGGNNIRASLFAIRLARDSRR